MRSFAEADERLGKRYSRKLQNNTYLYRRSDDMIAVVLHSTDVVTFVKDGPILLANRGWDTMTTGDRIRNYAPVRVYTVKGEGWHVFSSNDPITPPKIQKCRSRGCKEKGDKPRGIIRTVPHCSGPRSGQWEFRNGRHQYVHENWCKGGERKNNGDFGEGYKSWVEPCLHGHEKEHATGPCQHGQMDGHALPHRDDACYRCKGTGERDYGSNTIPTKFFDGIAGDSYGNVVKDYQPPAGWSCHTQFVRTYKGVKPKAEPINDHPMYQPEYKPSGDDYGSKAERLRRMIPGSGDLTTCPALVAGGASRCGQSKSVWDQIIHLNDMHAWKREDIADWLESLDSDLTLKTA